MKLPIHKLIASFDDEQGLPELTYEATRDLIRLEMGTQSALTFIKYIDATDGRFYLRTGCMEDALYDIAQVAVSPE